LCERLVLFAICPSIQCYASLRMTRVELLKEKREMGNPVKYATHFTGQEGREMRTRKDL
jgi:hypothetical protein